MTAVTGTDVIRRAMLNRVKKAQGFGRLRFETGIPDEGFRAFAAANNLSDEALDVIAREIWGGAVEFDPVHNLLRSSNHAAAKPLHQSPSLPKAARAAMAPDEVQAPCLRQEIAAGQGRSLRGRTAKALEFRNRKRPPPFVANDLSNELPTRAAR